jgi:hypothetical protein
VEIIAKDGKYQKVPFNFWKLFGRTAVYHCIRSEECHLVNQTLYMENSMVELLDHLTWPLAPGNLVEFIHHECCSLYVILCCVVMCLNKPLRGASSLSEVFYQACKDFTFQNWFWVGPRKTTWKLPSHDTKCHNASQDPAVHQSCHGWSFCCSPRDGPRAIFHPV